MFSQKRPSINGYCGFSETEMISYGDDLNKPNLPTKQSRIPSFKTHFKFMFITVTNYILLMGRSTGLLP